MKTPLLPVLLAATVAGTASALIVGILVRPSASPNEVPAAAGMSAAGSSEAGAIESELAALRGENRELRARVEALESRPIADARSSVDSVEEVAQAVAKLQVATTEASTPRGGEVYTQVEQALEAIRTAEREQAAREREQRELDRMEERLTQLGERLGLTPTQVNDLRAHLLAQERIEDDLRAQREAGMERDAYRVAREQAREAERAELARILTPEQLEQYNARREREDRGRDGGRGAATPGAAGGGGAAGAGRGGNGGGQQRRGN